jgi:phosphoglycolate phosphatase
LKRASKQTPLLLSAHSGQGVTETLRALRAAGTQVVAYTESRAFHASYRARALHLDGVLDVLYSPPDHALPDGVIAKVRKALAD